MIRRRPIPRFSPKPEHSLRYETILGGCVIVYPDGREVCVNSKARWIEYSRRVKVMWERQERRCCLCGKPLALTSDTRFTTPLVERRIMALAAGTPTQPPTQLCAKCGKPEESMNHYADYTLDGSAWHDKDHDFVAASPHAPTAIEAHPSDQSDKSDATDRKELRHGHEPVPVKDGYSPEQLSQASAPPTCPDCGKPRFSPMKTICTAEAMDPKFQSYWCCCPISEISSTGPSAPPTCPMCGSSEKTERHCIACYEMASELPATRTGCGWCSPVPRFAIFLDSVVSPRRREEQRSR